MVIHLYRGQSNLITSEYRVFLTSSIRINSNDSNYIIETIRVMGTFNSSIFVSFKPNIHVVNK